HLLQRRTEREADQPLRRHVVRTEGEALTGRDLDGGDADGLHVGLLADGGVDEAVVYLEDPALRLSGRQQQQARIEGDADDGAALPQTIFHIVHAVAVGLVKIKRAIDHECYKPRWFNLSMPPTSSRSSSSDTSAMPSALMVLASGRCFDQPPVAASK